MRAVVIYWSKTGNTAKAATAIKEGLEAGGAGVDLALVENAERLDYFDYDLVCIGFPSYQWSPPQAVVRLLKTKHRQYAEQGRVEVNAPQVPGKYALVFCTYSGPHTGIDEAIPAAKYAAQFFAHLGLTVLGEWYIVGEFHGDEKASTRGCLGDIRGRPNEQDLKHVWEKAASLVRRLRGDEEAREGAVSEGIASRQSA